MPNLNTEILGRVPLHVPPLVEQIAIAEMLGALDDKIAANTKVKTLSWALAEARFQLLVSGATARGRVGDVLSLEYGKSLPSGSRIVGDAAVIGSGGPVGQHSESVVPHSGVVVGRKGSAGAVHWVDGPHWPIDTTFWVQPRVGFSALFAYFTLRGLALTSMNNDSAVPGLNRNEAIALPARIPDLLTVEAFTAATQANVDVIAAMAHENRTLVALRDTLLPQLMSGKLRVRDAERAVGEVA